MVDYDYDYDSRYAPVRLGAAVRNPMPDMMNGYRFKEDNRRIILEGKHIRFRHAVYNPIVFPLGIVKTGVLFSGAAESGKTNVIRKITSDIIENMKDDELILIYDVKGDYIPELYVPGDTVIGPTRYTAVWNLFMDILFSENIELACSEMAEYLYKGRGSQQQPFFVNSAMLITAKTIAAMIRRAEESKDYRELTNFHLKSFLSAASAEDYRALLIGEESLVDHLLGGGSDQAAGVISEIMLMANQVLTGAFGGCGDFSVKEAACKRSGVIFLAYDLSLRKTMAPVFSSMIDMFISTLAAENTKRGRVYLIIDELPTLPTLEGLATALTLMREKVSCIAGIQNIPQVKAVYPQDNADVLLSAFQNQILLRAADGISAEYIKRMLGSAERGTAYMKMADHEVVEKYSPSFAVDETELMNLRSGEAFVRFGGHAPFFYRFDEYVKR